MNGRKTYIVGIAMIVYAVAGVASQSHDFSSAIELILEALAIMGLRHGIGKR